MNISHKSSNTQVFRLMVYQRALHPELFDLQIRRGHRQDNYEVEYWVVPGGHVARFQTGKNVLTEAVLERGDHLPETGLLYALPCLGEKEYELDTQDKIGYVTTVQTETLNENLYMATYREMCDFAQEVGAACHLWQDRENVPCLSVLDVQRYRKEFHIQSYHLVGANGLVLRTQSIFDVRE
ncbi:MAG: hypothetical protein IT443_11310 [Phycisphaeraceae bacterium]|nr:hypothetical protein [Phycisphaeraceae bacterium]